MELIRCELCHLVIRGKECPCIKTLSKARQEGLKHPGNTRRFRNIREHVKERDNNQCQRCYHKYNVVTKGELECHHIKSFRDYSYLAYDMNNLIMLCRRCNLDLSTKNKLDFEWAAPIPL